MDEARALLRGTESPGLPWVEGYPMEDTRDAVTMVIRWADSGLDVGPFGGYQLIRASDGHVIGDIGFYGPPDRSGAVTVGFGIAPTVRGHGYATEALRALIAWALIQPGVESVRADTTQANVASQRVMERAGMRLVDSNRELRFYQIARG